VKAGLSFAIKQIALKMAKTTHTYSLIVDTSSLVLRLLMEMERFMIAMAIDME